MDGVLERQAKIGLMLILAPLMPKFKNDIGISGSIGVNRSLVTVDIIIMNIDVSVGSNAPFRFVISRSISRIGVERCLQLTRLAGAENDRVSIKPGPGTTARLLLQHDGAHVDITNGMIDCSI